MEKQFNKVDYVSDYKININQLIAAFGSAKYELCGNYKAFTVLAGFVKNSLNVDVTGLKSFSVDSIGSTVNKVYKNRMITFKSVKNLEGYHCFIQWLVDQIKKTGIEHQPDSIIDLLLSLPRISDDMQGFTYYPSFEKMIQERPTKTTIGRALNYFGFNPEICRLVAEAYTRLLTEQKQTLFFIQDSKDPQQWVDVYSADNGFISCMNGNDCVKVYAHPNNTLTLAYLTEDNTPNGTTIARCICCTKTKTISRLYGHIADKVKLASMLEGAGYNPIETYNNDNETLEGQQIQFIKSRCGNLVMPYVDGHHMVEVNIENETARICSDGEFSADDTDGIMPLERGEYCPCCNSSGHDEDDMYWIESEGQQVCGDCINNDYSYCDLLEEYVSNDSIVEYIDDRGRSGNYASEQGLNDSRDYYRLDYSSEGCDWAHIDSIVFTYNDECIVHNDSICLNEEFYPDNNYCHESEETVQTHSGEYILQCDAEEFEGEWYHEHSDELKAAKEEAAQETAENTN